MEEITSVVLEDWMTTPEMPVHTKITETDEDNIYHSHNFYEIFYIIDGAITYNINGEIYKLSAGDIGFINKKDSHSFIRNTNTPCRHRDIIIHTDFFEEICHFIGDDFFSSYMNDTLLKIISVPFEKIERYEERITSLLTSPTNFFSTFQMSQSKTLLISLLNCLLEEAHHNEITYYPMWFRDLLGRFHMNHFLINGLDAILRPYHFNKAYMCRTFKRYMNCTMTEYLNEIRIQHATFRLIHTDDAIASICNSVGFSSVSYFNKLFKLKYGVSPNTFRKSHKTSK